MSLLYIAANCRSILQPEFILCMQAVVLKILKNFANPRL